MSNYLQSIVLFVLIVSPVQAQLRITEVEPAQADGQHQDWWELTNLGPAPVDLMGFKFDDSSAAIATSVTLSTSSLVIAPGESIVFVDTLTPEQFRTWWGPGLSLDARIITYTGSGLGLSGSGDAVNVWNAADTLMDSVTFGQATTGVSFGYDLGANVFGGLSQLGVRGAFAAVQNGDIGSPGIAMVPEPSPGRLMLILGGFLIVARCLRRPARTER
jgi:hypothetical protein